jgi:hypothetical protein
MLGTAMDNLIRLSWNCWGRLRFGKEIVVQGQRGVLLSSPLNG